MSRDLEDGSGDGGWGEVIGALRQGLLDIAVDLFKGLSAAIARVLRAVAGTLERYISRLRGADGSPGIGLRADAVREMSSREPSMDPRAYKKLSPKARHLARKLAEGGGVLDVRPGEVHTRHLAEMTRGFEREYAIIQGPGGDLKLIRGDEYQTVIPTGLFDRGYRFVVYSHPEDRIPGDFTELDKIRGRRNSMEGDLSGRARGQSTHIEAVVNKHGQVTYFDHTGILSLGGEPMENGPVNYLGFVVPFRQRSDGGLTR